VISKSVQAVFVVLLVLAVGGVTTVLLTRFVRDDPAVNGSTHDLSNDLDSVGERPVGGVSITAGRGDLVVRVTGGSCREPGGPKLELSENQSRTFRRIRVPQVDDGSGVSAASPAVRAIVWAQATTPLNITVAAADSACDVHEYSTKDSGVTWQQTTSKVEKWYKDPGTDGVVAPSGPVDTGCKGVVVSIMPLTKKHAKVVCADGTIRTTSDGGFSWTDVGELPGTTVAVFTGPSTGYASVSKGACKSRIHATADGGITWRARGCVHKEFIVPGLSGTEKRLVAGGPDGMRVSTDGGTTWKPPTMK
jgi:hypothetical protein